MDNLKNITVVKRDGTEVPFDSEKIRVAAERAFLAAGWTRAKGNSLQVTENVCNDINRAVARIDAIGGWLSRDNFGKISVEEIQDFVENVLVELYPSAAKAYILYRQKRTEARMAKSEMMKNVEKLVQEMNHDNANTQNSAASKMYGIAESVSKEYFLSKMSARHAENHRKGRIYIHDLGYYGLTWNCFFNPLGKMLKNGFDNGVGYIRPPKRIASAVALACIILQSSQNDMFRLIQSIWTLVR